MTETLTRFLEYTLPDELHDILQLHLNNLKTGQFEPVFREPFVELLLGHRDDDSTQNIRARDFPIWTDYIFTRLGVILANRGVDGNTSANENPAYRQYMFLIVALAAMSAFLQSNVTGPPLAFSSAEVILPMAIHSDPKRLSSVRRSLIDSLEADGEAAYKLTPNVELLCLADAILTCPSINKGIPAAQWARLRVNFLHQRLLAEVAPSLQAQIYENLAAIDKILKEKLPESTIDDYMASFLLERAAVHHYHGLDRQAKLDIDAATKARHFEYALTGLPGKKTKFQQRDINLLVVLAKSAALENEEREGGERINGSRSATGPEVIDLNDDTLLDSISFSQKPLSSAEVKDESSLPASLASLDPSSQPLLEPLDSIILLSIASSITNTNPEDGLTREETLPYATRVLEGGSSNWQVYTEALLRKSRIEGYRSRTIERGLLQLQALVDQVIADTSHGTGDQPSSSGSVSTFLPKPKEGESAPASQRLLYIFQLCSPYRWDLEAELASRWVSLGGLRSALDIYSRLEMWPEVALCYAGTDREDKAVKIIRRQLFHSKTGPEHDEDADEDTEQWDGSPRIPPPANAPRLYCILGDIEKDPQMYETAWEVSNQRYGRAQRSLGRHWWAQRDFAKAALAYGKALKVKNLDHATWFAFGCCLLELSQFKRAVDAFSRAVQIDDTDAESWSNLAAALLSLSPEEATELGASPVASNVIGEESAQVQEPKTPDPQRHIRNAVAALKQAIKHSPRNHRILSNLLTAAATLNPPSWADILYAQSHIIDLRGSSEGEACIDSKILNALVTHAIASSGAEGYDSSKPGLARMVVKLLDEKVTPLITGSAELWQLVAKVQLWRHKPASALAAHEKAWRAVTNKPGWGTGSEQEWDEVVDSTTALVSAYESLGPMETTEGMAAGSGQLVAKDWRFKARSAVRTVLGRAKAGWEGTAGWESLKELTEQLKS